MIIIEVNQIDLCYGNYRCNNATTEKKLLNSISQLGITIPLSVIEKEGSIQPYLLLDGFKRLRCAQKLNLHQIPITIIGDNEVAGVLSILCHNQSSTLNALEEAVFIERLNSYHGLSNSEIARRINRSVAWVNLRVEMSRSMSEIVRKKILSGKFPLRSYMYDLLPFTRVKGGMAEVEKFVIALSGKELSTRDIALLAHAFFRGEEEVKQQILTGNLDWTLRMLKTSKESPEVLKKPESNQTPIEKLVFILGMCERNISQIVEEFLNSPALLSEQALKKITEKLGNSCYCYLNTIQEHTI